MPTTWGAPLSRLTQGSPLWGKIVSWTHGCVVYFFVYQPVEYTWRCKCIRRPDNAGANNSFNTGGHKNRNTLRTEEDVHVFRHVHTRYFGSPRDICYVVVVALDDRKIMTEKRSMVLSSERDDIPNNLLNTPPSAPASLIR